MTTTLTTATTGTFDSYIQAPKNLIIPLDISNLIIDSITFENNNNNNNNNIELNQEQLQIKSLDGRAIVTFKNGNRYEGDFSNGMFHGQGIFYWVKEGATYKGDFNSNHVSGKGRFDWHDDSWYEGEVYQGLRHGYGTYWTASAPGGETTYTGEWKEGLRHGKGLLKFKSGAFYEGEFKKGMKHGIGKMTYPSGNFYEGEWAFDKKEGQGTMYWLSANEKYYGGWFDNKQNGFGVHIWLEPKSEGRLLRNRYEGIWSNGTRTGYGVFYYSNGAKYEGEWVNNLKEGFAIFTHDDGKISRSWFKGDKLLYNDQSFPQNARLFDSILPNERDSPTQNNNSSPIINDRATGRDGSQQRASGMGTGGGSSTRKVGKSSNVPSKAEFVNLTKKEDVDLNPYENMVSIEDLYPPDENWRSSQREVYNVLLRYHTEMRNWYQGFINRQNDDMEESFALKIKSLWRIFKDCNILSPKVTIASFNRLFLQGQRNNYELKTNLDSLRKKLEKAKRWDEERARKKRRKREREEEKGSGALKGKGVFRSLELRFTRERKGKQSGRNREREKEERKRRREEKREREVEEEVERRNSESEKKKEWKNEREREKQKKKEYISDLNLYCKDTSILDTINKATATGYTSGVGSNNNTRDDLNVPNNTKTQGEFSILDYSTGRTDIHDENRCVLYRQFADAMVRVAYLKYGGGKELAKSLEKLLNQKIKYNMENKKKLKGFQLENEQILQKIKPWCEKYRNAIKEWFEKFPAKCQSFLFDNYDYTMSIKGIIDCFTKANLIQKKEHKDFLIHVLERYYDPEETYNIAELMKEKEKTPATATRVTKGQETRALKYIKLIHSELIYPEFFDTLILYTFKKEDLQLKEPDIRSKFERVLHSLQNMAASLAPTLTGIGESDTLKDIIWPISEKDEMSKNLASEIKKREKECASHKQRRVEKENEERELKLMAKEDVNIMQAASVLSNHEDLDQESEGEEGSFYNDF